MHSFQSGIAASLCCVIIILSHNNLHLYYYVMYRCVCSNDDVLCLIFSCTFSDGFITQCVWLYRCGTSGSEVGTAPEEERA